MPPRRHQSQLSFLADDQPPQETSKDQMKRGRNVDNGNLSGEAGSKSEREKSSRARSLKSGSNDHLFPAEVRSQKGASSNRAVSVAGSKKQSIRSGKEDTSKSDASTRVSKERLTIHLSQELINRIRNVVYWTPGLTLADLGEDAFTRAVAEREKKRGGAFPQRKEELKGGRPVK